MKKKCLTNVATNYVPPLLVDTQKLSSVTKRPPTVRPSWSLFRRLQLQYIQLRLECVYRQKTKNLVILYIMQLIIMHRRRIKSEEKAKVVASVWKEEFIQFLAAIAVLPWTILKNRMNSSSSFKSSWCISSYYSKSS